jgi:hypothetical protein
MAAANTPHSQPAPLERPVFPDSFHGIMRTGGRVAAFGAEQGRKHQLVEPNQTQKGQAEQIVDPLKHIIGPVHPLLFLSAASIAACEAARSNIRAIHSPEK